MQLQNFLNDILANMPNDWIKLTTHRLDIYNEERAKVEFLEHVERLFEKYPANKNLLTEELDRFPTAFDYIRLGHPLSCLLEWKIAKEHKLSPESVISFSSQTMPIMAVLRRNLIDGRNTQIYYLDELPESFDERLIKDVYGYKFDLKKTEGSSDIPTSNDTSMLLINLEDLGNSKLTMNVDFIVAVDSSRGSIILASNESDNYIKEIQHVRRRESIAMTPNDCFHVLKNSQESVESFDSKPLLKTIKEITNTSADALLGSCGLSIQYAIMMGLIDDALNKHPNKKIQFLVPPNCYGGTNDQARRVAACVENVEIKDLPVDSGQNMVQSVEKVLENAALEDTVPFIIAEIPTNPRVEVPDLEDLKNALIKSRITKDGAEAIAPVFILDQTFCPNKSFLSEHDILSSVKTISYVSGSKFPSGGLCTAGYCVPNQKAQRYFPAIEKHLKLCRNEATTMQVKILTEQMPSMLERIESAYQNTRAFVDFVESKLPTAKINFVSQELSEEGFTPSVFSLDLPTKGSTPEEREIYKRALNLKLIRMMINEIPQESKHCVSYGQLKGCYWTIPATSTQGTTKEGDKDYIVRVSIAPDFDLESHKKVFARFCEELESSNK